MSRNVNAVVNFMVVVAIILVNYIHTTTVDAKIDSQIPELIVTPFTKTLLQTISIDKGDNTVTDGFMPIYKRAPIHGALPVYPRHPFIIVAMTQAIMYLSQETIGFPEQMIADSSLTEHLQPILLAGAFCDDVYSLGQWTGRVYSFHIYNDLLTLYPFISEADISHTWTHENSNGEWICGHSINFIDDVDSPDYGKTELRIEILSSDRSFSDRYPNSSIHHPFLMLSVNPQNEPSEKGMAEN